VSEIKEYVKAGHFPAGSMGPKVDAVIEFVESTGNRGIICDLDDIQKAVEGVAGTEISR
jgi:carbamate kinase